MHHFVYSLILVSLLAYKVGRRNSGTVSREDQGKYNLLTSAGGGFLVRLPYAGLPHGELLNTNGRANR